MKTKPKGLNRNVLFYSILILFLIASIEIIPNLLIIIAPDVLKNNKIDFFGHEQPLICWIFYDLAIIGTIYFVTTNEKISITSKTITIMMLITISLIVVLPIIQMINIILMSSTNNGPFFDYFEAKRIYPEISCIENSYQIIRDEFHTFMLQNKPKCFSKTNLFIGKAKDKNNSDNTSDEGCWRTHFVKARGKIIKDSEPMSFPHTKNILDSSVIHNAFFSVLDPNVEIPEHTGYYKGYLRFHLGIEIPECDKNKCLENAYIVVGGEKYHWKQGEGVVFDDMFRHYVKNPTGKRRVVLFIDLIRRELPMPLSILNRIGISYIESNPIIKLFLKNQHKQNKI